MIESNLFCQVALFIANCLSMQIEIMHNTLEIMVNNSLILRAKLVSQDH